MQITFKNKNLRKCAGDDRKARKELGALRAKLFKQRLDELSAADTLEDTRYLPGKYHELKGDRKGQWACNLDQPYRLIFEPHETPIPQNEAGQYIWTQIVGVEIIEITNYHER